MILAMIIASLLLLPSVFDLTRTPQLRRLAIRNSIRRPREAMLIIGGAMLGTAIIVSSFVVGDTLDATLTDTVRTELGPIDEVIFTDASATSEILELIDEGTLENVDGVLALTAAPVVAATTGAEPSADPRAWVSEADFDDLRSFGTDPAITGLAAHTGVDSGKAKNGLNAVIPRLIAFAKDKQDMTGLLDEKASGLASAFKSLHH